jgi:aminoglycoside 6'-N-acetyltransferase I
MLADRDGWAVFVASENELQTVGLVEAHLRDYAEGADSQPVGYIEGWFVLPEFRKRGIGRALIEAAEGWARSRGCSELASDAQLDNQGSIEAHGRLGFRETERIVCFLKRLDD